MTTTQTWDYEGYWNTVVGAYASAADAVRDLALEPQTDRQSVSEWLTEAETIAWAQGRQGADDDVPTEWRGEHHRRAVTELYGALVALAAEQAAEVEAP